jgi:hypothetical protein
MLKQTVYKKAKKSKKKKSRPLPRKEIKAESRSVETGDEDAPKVDESAVGRALAAIEAELKAALAKGALPSMLMAPEHAFPREGVPPAQTHAVDGLPDLQAVLDGMGSAAAAV